MESARRISIVLILSSGKRVSTYGPAYDAEIDQPRLGRQLEAIKTLMLDNGWYTLAEIEAATSFPQASISANLRHLRKSQFGKYQMEKRRREPDGGVWVYRLKMPFKDERQMVLF